VGRAILSFNSKKISIYSPCSLLVKPGALICIEKKQNKIKQKTLFPHLQEVTSRVIAAQTISYVIHFVW
jgi:hypothetical protein